MTGSLIRGSLNASSGTSSTNSQETVMRISTLSISNSCGDQLPSTSTGTNRSNSSNRRHFVVVLFVNVLETCHCLVQISDSSESRNRQADHF